jgi:hypothetical protein
MNPVGQQTSPGAKSAIGRTLAGANDVTVTAEAPPPMEMLPPEILPQGPTTLEGASPLTQGTPYDIGGAPEGNVYDGAAPAEGGGGFMSAFGEMDPLELATLCLSLGSMLLAQPQTPAPRPPGLPGSSMSPMKPVFRG